MSRRKDPGDPLFGELNSEAVSGDYAIDDSDGYNYKQVRYDNKDDSGDNKSSHKKYPTAGVDIDID